MLQLMAKRQRLARTAELNEEELLHKNHFGCLGENCVTYNP